MTISVPFKLMTIYRKDIRISTNTYFAIQLCTKYVLLCMNTVILQLREEAQTLLKKLDLVQIRKGRVRNTYVYF